MYKACKIRVTSKVPCTEEKKKQYPPSLAVLYNTYKYIVKMLYKCIGVYIYQVISGTNIYYSEFTSKEVFTMRVK